MPERNTISAGGGGSRPGATKEKMSYTRNGKLSTFDLFGVPDTRNGKCSVFQMFGVPDTRQGHPIKFRVNDIPIPITEATWQQETM